MASPDPEDTFVSRGGLKLDAALDHFAVDVEGLTCADLGASVGGFTDCLLQRGAARVYAVDTSYGPFAWKLRQDDRVTLLERTNVLHMNPADQLEGFAGCDLVVIDLGWTPQARALPAARNWLADDGQVVTLIKPQYEPEGNEAGGGVLDDDIAERVVEAATDRIREMGWDVRGVMPSPVRGGGRRGSGPGNREALAWLA
ncbi:MAG: SAM-dependent methyltransferase [Phycisphaeraceae bacterium]|nr:SAM-dependent methyltransferase [Phycisphaeraceae bacterium]